MIKAARNATYTCLIYEHAAEDPRDLYCSFGTMVCWHRRYDLGDKHTYDTPDEFLEDLCHGLVPDYENPEDLTLAAKLNLLAENPGLVILPLYLYDHSGLAMRTTSFADPWDSGQVGFIYATPETIAEEFGTLPNEAAVEAARILLREEVDEYSRYLSGTAYAFELYENDGVQIDSCYNILQDFNIEDHICKNYLSSNVDFRADDFEDYPGDTFDYLREHNLL